MGQMPSGMVGMQSKIPLELKGGNAFLMGDRVDSSLGYTVSNCVPCCKYCNQAKNDRSVSEFLAHARRIVEYQNAHQNPV